MCLVGKFFHWYFSHNFLMKCRKVISGVYQIISFWLVANWHSSFENIIYSLELKLKNETWSGRLRHWTIFSCTLYSIMKHDLDDIFMYLILDYENTWNRFNNDTLLLMVCKGILCFIWTTIWHHRIPLESSSKFGWHSILGILVVFPLLFKGNSKHIIIEWSIYLLNTSRIGLLLS